MRTYKLTIAYDGTAYKGWQRQETTDKTIQGVLEQVLTRIVGFPIQIDGSGRTDGGVHAGGQTASFKLPGKIEEEVLREKLNQELPVDICILKLQLVPNAFHARYSAKAKRYEYRLDLREKPDVFTRRYTYHFPYVLDVEAMRKAAGNLIGTYDFTSFCDKKEEDGNTRSIYEITIRQEKDKLFISYYGNGFLYHMVRILTGTLLMVGKGTFAPEEMKAILAAKERGRAGFLAPARGLFLQEVYYK